MIFFEVKAVFFDLDGTILDSMKSIYEALNVALESMRLHRIDAQTFGGMAGLPLEDMLREINCPVTPRVVKACEEKITKSILSINSDAYGLILGVRETLNYLKSRDIPLAIVTTTPKPIVDRDLKRFRLTRYFKAVVAREDMKKPKPAPDGVLKAARLLDVPVECCIFIGDSPLDIRAGKAAGTGTIAVLTGLCGKEQIQKENPDVIINSVAELPKVLETLSQKR